MKFAVLALLFGLGTSACQSPAPLAISVQSSRSTGPVLNLHLTDASQRSLLLRDGARFSLYKDQQLLQEMAIQDNAARLAAVDVAPPYTYRITQAVIEGYEPDRGVPIDTQGGLLAPGPTAALPLPAELNVPAAAKSPRLEGSISADLRQATEVTVSLHWPTPHEI